MSGSEDVELFSWFSSLQTLISLFYSELYLRSSLLSILGNLLFGALSEGYSNYAVTVSLLKIYVSNLHSPIVFGPYFIFLAVRLRKMNWCFLASICSVSDFSHVEIIMSSFLIRLIGELRFCIGAKCERGVKSFDFLVKVVCFLGKVKLLT